MENELEKQLGAMLNDPALLQKLTAIAGSLSGASGGETKEEREQRQLPDPQMLKNMAGMAFRSGIDPQQKSLLAALTPFLSRSHIAKLENAMRAAQMTKLATAMLNSSKPGR